MFLRRKFSPALSSAAKSGSSDAELDPELSDVVLGLALLLNTRRGFGHVLPDFGFSDACHPSPEQLITQFTNELRENLESYEPRVEVLDVQGDLGDNGRPELLFVGRLRAQSKTFTLRIDPIARQVFLASVT